MAEDWQELAAAASEQKDPEKVHLLIEKLIEALSQEQQRIRDEIEKRLAHATEATERKI